MVFSDGSNKAEIKVSLFDGTNMTDFSDLYFEDDINGYDEEQGTYIVADIDRLIEKAEEWRSKTDSFSWLPDVADAECLTLICRL